MEILLCFGGSSNDTFFHLAGNSLLFYLNFCKRMIKCGRHGKMYSRKWILIAYTSGAFDWLFCEICEIFSNTVLICSSKAATIYTCFLAALQIILHKSFSLSKTDVEALDQSTALGAESLYSSEEILVSKEFSSHQDMAVKFFMAKNSWFVVFCSFGIKMSHVSYVY